MELIPESQRPVSGTEGALERRRQLLSQLPVYDQDPMRCQSLASDEEVHPCQDRLITHKSRLIQTAYNFYICALVQSSLQEIHC